MAFRLKGSGSKKQGASVTVPPEVQETISKVVDECVTKATRLTGVTLSLPTILYTLRGTTAGWACRKTCTINLNSVLLMENQEHFINRTVPHEVAHVIADQMFDDIRPHGPEWRTVMRMFGLKPTRCHQYDTTNSRVRAKNKFRYSCCSLGCTVGPTVHRRIQGGSSHRCRACRSRLTGASFVQATKEGCKGKTN